MISKTVVEYISSLEPDITLKIHLMTAYMFTKKAITTLFFSLLQMELPTILLLRVCKIVLTHTRGG
jgi:hypothetical protein